MSVITYEPNVFDVPAGTYVGRLSEVLDKPPFEASKFGASTEPRLAWRFEVVGPPGNPAMGKVIEQGTGTKASAKSGLVRLLTLLMGRAPSPGEKIDPAHFIGREYQILWAVNPKSEQGNCHISSMMALTPGQPAGPMPTPAPAGTAPPPAAGARVPVPTPPPPKPKPAASAPSSQPAPHSSVAPVYWVQMPDDKVVEMSKATLQAHLDMGSQSTDEVPVLDQAQVSGGWKTAKELGFTIKTPFDGDLQ